MRLHRVPPSSRSSNGCQCQNSPLTRLLSLIWSFNQLFQRLSELNDERLIQRIRLSIDWHRSALRETDALSRFIGLWTAMEPIGNPLAEYYKVKAKGWHGLRQLAEDEGHESRVISEALDIRRHLFHYLSIRPDDIRPRAEAIVPVMEHLLVAGWTRLLGMPEAKTDFPASTVTPYPVQHELRVVILEADSSIWRSGVHPHLAGKFIPQRVPSENPDSVVVNYTLEAEARNFQQFRPMEYRVWGPFGPNIPTIEPVESKIE